MTRRGEEAVVILAAKDYRHLTGRTARLMDCLLRAPRGQALALDRSAEGIRNLDL